MEGERMDYVWRAPGFSDIFQVNQTLNFSIVSMLKIKSPKLPADPQQHLFTQVRYKKDTIQICIQNNQRKPWCRLYFLKAEPFS